jgi:transcriptional regulator with XRE-family HTH domain
MTFAAQIKRSLKASGLHQKQFAAKLDISPRLLQSWLSGKQEPKAIPARAYLEAAETIANQKLTGEVRSSDSSQA